ncbi:MAG: diguanylate cyclase [Chloroflexota bacterium]|nr:MAG: diguanylate cyclase [Chloroflexota bacterium]
MTKETILVVDDSRQIADFIAGRLLSGMGYDASVVYNGRSAIEFVRKNSPALILLDYQLSDMTGLEVVHALAKENFNIPVILVTGYGSEQTAVEAFRLGVQDYLIKPVDPDKLNMAVRRALTETRLRNEKLALMAQLKEQVTWMTVLSSVGKSVTSILELDEVLRKIVEAGVQLTRAEEGFLALLDEQNGQLYVRAVKNIDEDKTKTLRLPVDDSLVGSVIRSKKPLRMVQRTNQPPLKVSTGFLVYSFLHVPLISKGRVQGVLSVYNRSTRQDFKDTDEALLTSLGDYAAIAIENASLYQRAQQEIKERGRVEMALRESEERYALAVRGANDGIWDWNLKTNKIYYSPRWKAMLGFGEEEISDSPDEWFRRIHPADIDRVKLDIAAHYNGITSHFENENRMRHKDGSYRWVASRGLAVKDSDGSVNRMAGSQTDITDRKCAEQKLLHDAFHDMLTGLANRALFIDRLKHAVERAKRREEYKFAVLFLDLDRFKDINDSHGHMMGDQLLIQTAQIIAKEVRTIDTVARLGGDEFVLLLEDIVDVEDATRIADRIQKEISSSFALQGREMFVTTSIGIVLSTLGYNWAEDVLRDADIAMYRAKALGKARYVIFDPGMRNMIMERLVLETDLRHALDRKELKIFYQPIVNLGSNRTTGFEALVRWDHPERG